jgi:hypothetical protein
METLCLRQIVQKRDITKWDESPERSGSLESFLALVMTAGIVAGLVLIAITLGRNILFV